jgi:hypothetical protein
MKVAVLAWHVVGIGLRRAMCWRSCVVRCVVSTGCALGVSSSLGILRGSLYTSSATDVYRSALNDVLMPGGRREVLLSNVSRRGT